MIENMRKPAKVLSELMDELRNYVKPGMTTNKIDQVCHKYILGAGGVPAALNYKGFPKSICTSVNSIVCHGIPNDIPLQNGDIISIDIVINIDGYHADSCITIGLGTLEPKEEKLIEVSHETMWNAIEAIKSGASIKQLGMIMQTTAESYGLNVIRDFAGHGIGKFLHEEPLIPFYYCPQGKDSFLKPGMFITIEPMVTLGYPNLRILPDGWSAKMLDKKKTSQFEHTIHVTDEGYEVLTYNKFDFLRGRKKTQPA